MTSSPGTRRVDVPFLAPVPRGHEIGFARIRHPEAELFGELLLDLTAGISYCAEPLHGLLAHPRCAEDPLLVARGHGWVVDEHVLGRVVGTVVSTQPGRALPAARSTLFVDPSPRPEHPYRG